MHPLNPLLRAFFRSTVPGQCVPIENHVLLVPVSDSLIGSRDRESSLFYSDLVVSEEFLGSHTLRIPSSGGLGGKDDAGVRDGRGKARQVTTVNGRTVIIRDNSVYSNKGFKSLSQAQLLSDALYYAPNSDSQPWLIYFISRPLIGSFEPGRVTPAVIPGLVPKLDAPQGSAKSGEPPGDSVSSIPKKEIRTFGELLAHFPMIARQMQAGLERLFREFGKELGKPLPPPPSSRSPMEDGGSGHARVRDESLLDEAGSIRSSSSRRSRGLPFNSDEYFEDDEDLMRRSLETAVTAAIDLFRLVDQQQLSLLGATTDLTGPVVERFIERYVAEQVHETLLFPRLCSFREQEDAELDSRIRQLEYVDISQVGLAVEGGREGKRELLLRLSNAVDQFRKILDGKCPHDMLNTLLETVKILSYPGEYDKSDEKHSASVTVNADILVSLLLIVVIRSQVKHLQARLLYMQHFIYIDDVDSGEMGYALSTFEAVLAYLMADPAGLRRASIRNKRLWNATKSGRVADMKAILEPDGDHESLYDGQCDTTDPKSQPMDEARPNRQALRTPPLFGSLEYVDEEQRQRRISSEVPPLAHVFPFQTWESPFPPPEMKRPIKKVSMDVCSLSESSGISLLSRTTTMDSVNATIEGDSSIETLAKTQDPQGDSILMMAVESGHPEALKYLLSLNEYYSVTDILGDTNTDGTTLFSAAVQLAQAKIVDILINYLLGAADEDALTAYFRKADERGRTVAHYLFSTPSVMRILGSLLPWRQRDKHGQTPLFALCRSYDHPDYKAMVNEALTVAQESQQDGKPLRLDDHVDSKGNTLLHIVSDPDITIRILRESDCDPNATNDKHFTPLMMASKYGRVDQVRILFSDSRVDLHVKEARGLTAVELAKDDEVRNRIDDLILLSNSPSSHDETSGRVTTVVRSFFVEDATVRLVLKSGAPSPPVNGQEMPANTKMYTVTTCRRTFSDFETLAECLTLEHPASYMPSLSDFRSPFQIHSKPSRAVLHNMQERLDKFLKILLSHPTFATHELLWEFILVPELQPQMMTDRSHRKAQVLSESIVEEQAPITPDGIREAEQFISHAQDMVRVTYTQTRTLLRRGHALQNATSDVADAVSLCSSAVSTLGNPTNALPQSHIDAFTRYAAALSTSSSDSSPLLQFLATLTSIDTTTSAILASLSRPLSLMSSLNSASRNLSRSRTALSSSSLPRKFNLNFPGLEESRLRSIRDLNQKVTDSESRVARLSRELSWNKDVVVGELAGWTSWREAVGREAIRTYVRSTLVRERERRKRLERCLRGVREVG
ncbi:putative VPS9 domain protein [Aspergillus lucknowensis]|uniref:VPS9 domain-containing protein n=1 Tax=Aspergillus lucknowensis TaxID=176173 RepID=A0ABR4M6E0_9EURO